MSDKIPWDALDYWEQARPRPDAKPAAPAAAEPERFERIGGYTPRLDGKLVVTGRAAYAHDLRMEGMLWAKILRSPHACAEIVMLCFF